MKLKRDFRKELIPIKLCAIAFIQLIGGWKQSRRVKNGMHVSCYDYGTESNPVANTCRFTYARKNDSSSLVKPS